MQRSINQVHSTRQAATTLSGQCCLYVLVIDPDSRRSRKFQRFGLRGITNFYFRDLVGQPKLSQSFLQ